jgi:hypothetical protein
VPGASTKHTCARGRRPPGAPGPEVGVHGPVRGAVAAHPRNGDQARSPLVPIRAPLRVGPPLGSLYPALSNDIQVGEEGLALNEMQRVATACQSVNPKS